MIKTPAMITNRQSVVQIVRAASSDIISALSGDIFSFSLSLMLLHATQSAVSFGLGQVIYPVIGLLLVVPISNYIDTHAHKPLILISKLVALVSLIGYSLVIFQTSHKLLASVVIITIFGICDKFSQTGYTASVHELVNSEHIKPLTAIEQAATSGVQLFSPLIATLLYTLIGFGGVLKIEIVAETLVLVITLSMHFHPQPRTLVEAVGGGQLVRFKRGLTYILQHNVLRFVVQMAIWLNLLFAALTIGLPYVMIQQLHLGNTKLGWVMSALSAGILLGNLVLTKLPEFKNLIKSMLRLVFIFGSAFIGVGLLFLGRPGDQIIVVSLMSGAVLLGVMLALINTPISVYMQTTVPTEMLGRIGGTVNTLTMMASPLGILAYSWLFQRVPAWGIFLGTGALVFVLIAVFWHLGNRPVEPTA